MDTPPQPGEQLDAIAHAARRQLLVTLLDAYPQEDMPIEPTAWMAETDTEASLAAMRHTHLPKLEDCGFIHWDRETQLVTHGPQFGEIEPLLTALREHQHTLPAEWL